MSAPRRGHLSLRLPPDLDSWVRGLAAASGWSVNRVVTEALAGNGLRGVELAVTDRARRIVSLVDGGDDA